MSIRSRITEHDTTRRLLRAGERRIELAFTLLVTAFMSVLLWKTFEYSGHARTIPLIVAIPTFAFLLIVLLGLISSKCHGLLQQYQLDDFTDMDSELEDLESDEDGESTDDSRPLEVRRLEFVIIAAWIAGGTTLLFVVGIKEAIAVFLLGYYRFEAGQTLPRTIAYSALVWAFIYGLFDVMLGMSL